MLIRHSPLLLALPWPPDEVADLVDWARSVLPPDIRPLVREAREIWIRVVPHVHGDPSTLSEALGTIGGRVGEWSVLMVVVEVLVSPERPRHSPMPLAWPAHVVHNGRRFPPARGVE